MTPYDAQAAAVAEQATARFGAIAPSYEPGLFASTLASNSTQAERAVMHPEHHDPDWRYYHAAGVG